MELVYYTRIISGPNPTSYTQRGVTNMSLLLPSVNPYPHSPPKKVVMLKPINHKPTPTTDKLHG